MNCAPGGRAPTSEMAKDPSGRRNHSMCDNPVCRPRDVTAWVATPAMSAYSGPATSRGNRTHHWIHGFSSTSRGVGRYRPMEYQTSWPLITTLSNECSAPVMNSSSSIGSPGWGADDASHCSICSARSTRNVFPRASTREWFGHERESHTFGERAGVILGVDPLTPGAWHFGRLERRLHLRLVAEVAGNGLAQSLDAHPVAHCSQWHLQVFEDRHQSVDGAKVSLHPARGVYELVDIETVVGAPVPGDDPPHRLWEGLHRVAADETDAHVPHGRLRRRSGPLPPEHKVPRTRRSSSGCPSTRHRAAP